MSAAGAGETIINVLVLDDGTVAMLSVGLSSGYPDIDERIEQMIRAVGRFPPLPQWYQGPSMHLEFRLQFPEALEGLTDSTPRPRPMALSEARSRDRSPGGSRIIGGRAGRESAGFLAFLGPGLITGASDDDPSGIATYSQVGAQFGYGMSWVMLFTWPLMAAIQEISARIGRVTGEGIAGNIREHYPRWLLRVIVALLLVANIINLGADLGAMGAALQLLLGGPVRLYVVALPSAARCSKYSRATKIMSAS